MLDEVSLHTLVSSLAAWSEEFSRADFCDVVFDQFLLLLVSDSNILRHTLRLLWYVLPKMDPQKVVHVLTLAQPSSEVCDKCYMLLVPLVTQDDCQFFILNSFDLQAWPQFPVTTFFNL